MKSIRKIKLLTSVLAVSIIFNCIPQSVRAAETVPTEIKKETVTQPVEKSESVENIENPKPVENSEKNEKDEKVEKSEEDKKDEGTEVKENPKSAEKSEQTSKETKELVVKKVGTDKQVVDKNKEISVRGAEQHNLFKIVKSAVVGEDKTVTVTTTITPDEIYKGAEVIILLDVSRKMDEGMKKTAKEKITKIVKTLSEGTHKNRNSVRLISFYRNIQDAVELNVNNVEQKIEEAFANAKNNYDYGVNIQGAIHKAVSIFDNEQKSEKRQHIVLLSQGEATFSFDIKDKEKTDKKTINEDFVVSENPLLPWPFYVDYTNKKANLLKDFKEFLSVLNRFGIHTFDKFKGELDTANILSFFGLDKVFNYVDLKEYSSNKLSGGDFDYSKTVGEGYHNHSYESRKVTGKEIPFKNTIMDKIKKEVESKDGGALRKFLDKVAIKTIELALDNIFYPREYIFYNHNLSAQAESKIAQEKKIKFYSVDVTEKTTRSASNEQDFDKYLKEMSEGNKFLDAGDGNLADKFEDILKEIVLEDKTDKDFKAEIIEKTGKAEVKEAGSLLWILSTDPMVKWTLNDKEIKEAFEKNEPLKLVYKLKPQKDTAGKTTDLVKSSLKYRINEGYNRNEDAGKLILKLQDFVVESNLVDEKEDTNKNITGAYPDDMNLTVDEDTKEEKQEKPNVEIEKKSEEKSEEKPVPKEETPKVEKEDENAGELPKTEEKQVEKVVKENKMVKTSVGISSSVGILLGLVGMFIVKRKNK